jgi:hypothetical protein
VGWSKADSLRAIPAAHRDRKLAPAGRGWAALTAPGQADADVLTGFSPGPGPTADAVTALASDLSGDGPPLSRDAISDAAAGAWYPPKTAAGRDAARWPRIQVLTWCSP